MNIQDIVDTYTPDIDAPHYYYFGLQNNQEKGYSIFVKKQPSKKDVDALEIAFSLSRKENRCIISCCRIQAYKNKAKQIHQELDDKLEYFVRAIRNNVKETNRFFNLLEKNGGCVSAAIEEL